MTDVPEPRPIGTAAPTVDAGLDPRTGEPRRPVLVQVASALFLTGVGLVVAGLLWAFWRSVHEFAEAAWLNGVVGTEPGSLARVLLVVALFVATLLVGAAAIIAGHYAWRGFRWSRWAGVVAAVASLLSLLLNWVAWLGIAPIVAGAALLWTPPVRAWFDRWWLRRHPAAPVVEAPTNVYYGPLPRYQVRP